MDGLLRSRSAQRPLADMQAGGSPALQSREAARAPLHSAGSRFQSLPLVGRIGASAQSYRPRAEPMPAKTIGAQTVASPRPVAGNALAVTGANGTVLSPDATDHPRAREIGAHEAVHRAQFAAAGRLPLGDRPSLEAEARAGSRRLMRGLEFEPTLAAPADAELTFEYASAGEHLNNFAAWLSENTNYDTEAIDWRGMVDAMLTSDHILDFTEADQSTAVELSDLYRYWILLEIFQQELNAAEPPSGALPAAAAGLVVPTMNELEDTLFEKYMPTLSASDFDPSDVEAVSQSFLEHWLGQLEQLKFVPDTFKLQDYQPESRSWDFETERKRILDQWFKENIQNLMFMFMLDEFARAIQGPHADVKRLSLILGGGESRSLTAQHWLETLDLEQYKERLVDHLTQVFMAHLGKERSFRKLLRTEADERSRYNSLVAVHFILSRQAPNIASTAKSLRTEASGDLDDADRETANDPALEYQRMSKVSAASLEFYNSIQPAYDNDEALIKVLEKLIAAVTDIKDLGATWALGLRLGNSITAFKKQVEEQREQVREDIEARVKVSYADIAAGIQEMGKFAGDYLENTWIPKLHEVALRRITANVEVMQDRYDNWATYSKETAESLDARATAFFDIARGLKKGEYDRVDLGNETVYAADAKRLEDAAKIMRAEANRQRDPKESSKQRKKLKEALDGFEDVKERISSHKEDPLVYGPDVYDEAKTELHLNAFREYTTYGDVIFGRAVAAENPFLARLVIGWEMVEKIDRNLKNFTILVGLGLLTVASLLAGPLAAGAARWVGTAVSTVLFAVDAAISIGMAWHDKNEAEALLQLVRLDLDHSVTGVSEEDAERALTMAWVGLALSVLVTVGVVGAGLYFKFARGGTEVSGLSLRYYKLIREDPELFNSLRRIVRDPVKFDRMLELAGDAKELEKLLHRMGGTLDLARVERLIELTSDAAQTGRMLDVTSNARNLEAMLGELKLFSGSDQKTFNALLATTDDIPTLINVTRRSGDLPTAQALLKSVPDVSKLSGMLNAATDGATLTDLIKRIGSAERTGAMLERVGAKNGPRLLEVLKLPGAASLSEDSAVALTRLDADAIGGLRSVSGAELEDMGGILEALQQAGVRDAELLKGPTALRNFAGDFAKFSEGERVLVLQNARNKTPGDVLRQAERTRADLKLIAEEVEPTPAQLRQKLEAGTRKAGRKMVLSKLRETGPYYNVIPESALQANVREFGQMRKSLKAFAPDAIIGIERGGPFVADAATYGDADLASKIVRFEKGNRGDVTAAMRRDIEKMIADGKRRFAFTDVYFSGSQVRQLQKDVINPLAQLHPECQFRGVWLRESLGFEKLEAAGGAGAGVPAVEFRAGTGNVVNEPYNVTFAVGEDAGRLMETNNLERVFVLKKDGTLKVVDPIPGEKTTRELVLRLLGGG